MDWAIDNDETQTHFCPFLFLLSYVLQVSLKIKSYINSGVSAELSSVNDQLFNTAQRYRKKRTVYRLSEKSFLKKIFKAKIKFSNRTNIQAMKVVFFVIASFLVVELANSNPIPPDEVRTPIANVSDGKLLFAHVVSLAFGPYFIFSSI